MTIFLKAAAGVLISIVLYIAISKQGSDYSLLIAIAVCTMLMITAVSFIEPVFAFIRKLESVGKLNSEFLEILFKVVGTGILAEIVGLICIDAGNASMGKALKFLASGVILFLSIPLFSRLLELIEEILGNI